MGIPEIIDIPVAGATTKGYLASPASRRGRPIVVLHELWGLVGFVKEVCDKLSHENYFAIAPDLYHTSSSYDAKIADQLLKSLKVPAIEQEIGSAAKVAFERPGCIGRKFAIVGYGIGGQLALHAATVRSDIACSIAFCPYFPGLELNVADLKAPALCFFGEQDETVPVETARQLEQSLRDAGKSGEVHIVPGAKHAFFNQKRKDVFDVRASADAWVKMKAFLKKHLGA